MKYHYINKSNTKLIICLHGTGGDEKSLIRVVERIDDKASVLGIRGNIVENGLNRFFKRIKPGVFDLESLVYETNNLKHFIDNFVENHKYLRENVVVIGYSNGANILASLILSYGKIIKSAILMHPMVPFRNGKNQDLDRMAILITAGRTDPMVSEDETIELDSIMTQANAEVKTVWQDTGHEITLTEIDLIKQWYISNT